MEKVLVHTTWGPTDPTRAGIAFAYAMVAKAEDVDVTVFLFHDAVLLSKKDMYPRVLPVGPPPLTASIDFLVDENVTIYVCKPCFELRGLSSDDLVSTAKLAGMNVFFELSKTRKVVGF